MGNPNYYKGQKLQCKKDNQYLGITKGNIYTLGRTNSNGNIEVLGVEPLYMSDEIRTNKFWHPENIHTYFIDATKLVSELKFNKKFDTWLEQETE